MAVLAVVRAMFKGGDLNLPARIASRLLGRRVVGSGVLWLTVPRRGWRVVTVTTHDVGGDHDAVLVTMLHRRTSTVARFLVINCMSVSAGPLHSAAIMRAGIRLRPDVIIASECADFRADRVDIGERYWWDQPGSLGSPESGALIGGLLDTTTSTGRDVRLGSRETSEGGGVRDRSIVRDRITMKAGTS